MINCILVIIQAFIFNFHVYGEEYSKLLAQLKMDKVKAFQFVSEINRYQLKILIFEKNNKDQLSIFETKKDQMVVEYIPEEPINMFKYLNIIIYPQLDIPIVVTHWSHGAHGEKVFIHYKKNDKWLVTKFVHDWPILVNFKKTILVIDKLQDKSKKSQEAKKEEIWRP